MKNVFELVLKPLDDALMAGRYSLDPFDIHPRPNMDENQHEHDNCADDETHEEDKNDDDGDVLPDNPPTSPLISNKGRDKLLLNLYKYCIRRPKRSRDNDDADEYVFQLFIYLQSLIMFKYCVMDESDIK